MNIAVFLIIMLFPTNIFPRDLTDVFLRENVSNRNPYEGEQCIYTIQIFSSVKIEDIEFVPPDFKGFISEPLGESSSFDEDVAGGTFRVIEMYPFPASIIKPSYSPAFLETI